MRAAILSSPLAMLLALMLLASLPGCRSDPQSSGAKPKDAAAAAVQAPAPAWVAALEAAAARIDDGMPVDFGLYVRRVGEEASVDSGRERRWYLSSTIKIPVAIAVLEQVDAGQRSLDDELVLAQSDFIDGAGDMLAQKPGTRYSLATLIEKSLRDSDSTATDMLVRLLGEAHLNQRVRHWVGDGFGPITSIVQVRYDAYGPLHPGVAKLSNMDLLRLRNAAAGEPRLAALAARLGVPRSELNAKDIDTVFDTYYATGRNSATLPAFALLLEKLVRGELLSEASTQRLLDHMSRITTGTRRVQAGLPAGIVFAQKTGTQIQRACNVGVLAPEHGADGAVLVVACAENFGELANAERAFQQLGTALGESGVL
ncbi:MAG TPA: serine hydrolase [Pseudoxanthomonas sp.]|nr:serine hydrolase [Pseudoxanthomonas sp.]